MVEALGNTAVEYTRKLGKVAVLVPCFNEEAAINSVVCGFRVQLPDAAIYVYDNNSSDGTAEVAREAGAIVFQERLQGKGNVVRRMFADIEADTYVLVDGDGTYDIPSLALMLQAYVDGRVDMVSGARISNKKDAFRVGHRFGNLMFTALVSMIFGRRFADMLSGYRVFSRRFVKSFPILSSGFEIETELTIHALELRMATGEVETPYHARPKGSASKLNTFRDGWRILMTIGRLVRQERPLQLFATASAILATTSVVLFVPILIEFIETGLVLRFPTAILSTGLMILAFLSLVCGLILDTVTRGRQEAKRMRYLSIPGPSFLADT